MIAGVRRIRGLSLIAIFARTLLAGSEAFAVDTWYAKATIETTIQEYFDEINRGDVKAIVASCAARTTVVDGFPPYAWQTAPTGGRTSSRNNRAIGATPDTLLPGKAIVTERQGVSEPWCE